ncbi:MAG: GGDEF domain-containing protein [Eubacteriales bacterium]
MYHEPFHIVEGSIYAYILMERKTAKIIDWNHLAREFYHTGDTYPEITKLFTPAIDGTTMETTIKQLEFNGAVSLENIFSFKASDESFPCHVEICQVDDEHLLLVIYENSLKDDKEVADILELSGNPIVVMEQDADLTITFQNGRFQQYANIEREIQKTETTSFLKLLPREKREKFHETLIDHIGRSGEFDMDIELTFGQEYFQLFHFNAFESRFDGKLYGVLISVKKQSDLLKKIEYEQQYLDIVQKFTKDLLFRIDVRKRTLVHRGDIANFTDLVPELNNFPECVRDLRLLHPDDLEGYIAFNYRLMSGLESKYEARFLFTNGTFERYRLQGSPLVDTDGNTIQVVGKSENIQKIVDIEHRANYDALTTTLNRNSFKELVDDMLRRAVSSDKFAILFLDIDDFKGINDTMGHVFGDFILEAISKRILNCVRSQDKVGRVGGDEFVIFFQFAPSHDSVLERAEAILHSLRREFNKDGEVCNVKASIGISLYPEHADLYDDLYHKADLALYESKERGKDVATIYTTDMG